MIPEQDDPGALVGATGAGEDIAEQRSVPDTATPGKAPELRRLRRQRAVYELLVELARHHPEIADDLDRRLAAYAERPHPALLRATGGDRFPTLPLRTLGGAT